jgi:hypothetical protein
MHNAPVKHKLGAAIKPLVDFLNTIEQTKPRVVFSKQTPFTKNEKLEIVDFMSKLTASFLKPHDSDKLLSDLSNKEIQIALLNEIAFHAKILVS